MATLVSVAAGQDYELLTADDFLEWLEPGKSADLIDGEIELHSPVSIAHARLLNFVDRLLGSYVDRHKLGEVFREVVAVRLSSRNVFMPDLAFYRADRGDVFRETHTVGAPDLVVEVLSPRTAERDIGVKFAEYEQHGVREYWILDPETRAHRFYRREGELLVEFCGAADGNSRPDDPGRPRVIESSVVPGFFVRREWLNPEQLPSLDDALEAIEAGQRG